jgi:translation initiation factor 2 beta subunit (eIF-2beta)/eIF-5
MSAPDFVICLVCDSPCYTFEWEEEVTEALCAVCGNDDPDQFITEEDLEALGMEPDPQS